MEGNTVGGLLDVFLDEYPGTASQLVDDDGDIRPSVRVMVDDEKATLDHASRSTTKSRSPPRCGVAERRSETVLPPNRVSETDLHVLRYTLTIRLEN